MNKNNSIYMTVIIVITLVFTTGGFVGCEDKKKEEVTKDRKEKEESSNVKVIKEKRFEEKTSKAGRDRESPLSRKPAETTTDSEQPGDEPPADDPPSDEPPADNPPSDEPPGDNPPSENTTKSSVSEAQTPFPQGKEVPHSECNTHYKSGTAHFRAKEWDKAVEAFVKYPQGRCLGRVTNATDVWLAHRAFMATCHTEDNRYQEAFRKVHEKTCKSWGNRAPCTKPLKCPKKQPTGQNCATLYNNGTQAFKEQKYQECLDFFEEYRTKSCFGRLTKSTDLWVAYRAIVSADKLGKNSNAFMSKLKATCRVESGWPCKKLLKD